MDNQQGTTIMDASWLAGLFQGEGCLMINISKAKHRRMPLVDVRANVSLNDKVVVESAYETSRSLGSGCWLSSEGYRCSKGNRLSHRLEWAGHKRVRTLLSVIHPYLLGQRKKMADLLIKYLDQREKKGKYSRLDKEDWQLIYKFALNQEAHSSEINQRRLSRIQSYMDIVDTSETTRGTSLTKDEDIVHQVA